MIVIRHVPEMHRWAAAERSAGHRIGFVPTMGYLHEGHLSLVRLARNRTDRTVVSVLVNPLQFGPNEDLERYPRDFEHDSAMLAAERTDVIYYPDAAELYPSDYATYVTVEGLTAGLCGARRPGHFRGVTTVVAKLFNAVQPHLAVFGAKDAQQAYVIKRMVRDLDWPIEILVAPTVREADGLALSSRNRYLSPEERAQAPVLFQALRRGEELIRQGERRAGAITAAISAVINQASRARIDYVAIVDTDRLEPQVELRGEVLLALAVYLGTTRLIDNLVVQVP